MKMIEHTITIDIVNYEAFKDDDLMLNIKGWKYLKSNIQNEILKILKYQLKGEKK